MYNLYKKKEVLCNAACFITEKSVLSDFETIISQTQDRQIFDNTAIYYLNKIMFLL
jgi:hypothetical protein